MKREILQKDLTRSWFPKARSGFTRGGWLCPPALRRAANPGASRPRLRPPPVAPRDGRLARGAAPGHPAAGAVLHPNPPPPEAGEPQEMVCLAPFFCLQGGVGHPWLMLGPAFFPLGSCQVVTFRVVATPPPLRFVPPQLPPHQMKFFVSLVPKMNSGVAFGNMVRTWTPAPHQFFSFPTLTFSPTLTLILTLTL